MQFQQIRGATVKLNFAGTSLLAALLSVGVMAHFIKTRKIEFRCRSGR